MLQIKDCIEFIRQHKMLQKWSDEQLAVAIQRSIKQCAFAFTTSPENKLTGIVFGEWLDDCKTFYAKCLIGELKVFVAYLKQTFPQCTTVAGSRRNNLMHVYTVGENI